MLVDHVKLDLDTLTERGKGPIGDSILDLELGGRPRAADSVRNAVLDQ
jgi:hypothetical protein